MIVAAHNLEVSLIHAGYLRQVPMWYNTKLLEFTNVSHVKLQIDGNVYEIKDKLWTKEEFEKALKTIQKNENSDAVENMRFELCVAYSRLDYGILSEYVHREMRNIFISYRKDSIAKFYEM